jgi:hypothetical protein
VRCIGAADVGSDAVGPGTTIVSFMYVLICHQRPDPDQSTSGHADVHEHSEQTAGAMQRGDNADGCGWGGSGILSAHGGWTHSTHPAQSLQVARDTVGGGGLPAHGRGAYSLHTAQSLPRARDNVGGGGSCNGSSGDFMLDDDTGVFESGLGIAWAFDTNHGSTFKGNPEGRGG